MDEPVLLQTGPESFRVLLGGGRELPATLSHVTRRGLGAHGLPPLTVATEIVRFLVERGALPTSTDGEPVSLGAAAGRQPGSIDELRSRLS